MRGEERIRGGKKDGRIGRRKEGEQTERRNVERGEMRG